MALCLARRDARHGGQVETAVLQRVDQMPRQRRVAGVVAIGALFLKSHARHVERRGRRSRFGVGTAGAMVNSDRRHVRMIEHFLLVVANDDQGVKFRSGDVAMQTGDRRQDIRVPFP